MRLKTEGVEIRLIETRDFHPVLALIRQLPGNVHRWATESLQNEILRSLMEGADQEAFVATLRQRVIGFVSLYYMRVLHHGGLVASIQELVVTAELRGRGVGHALFEFVKARAEQKGCTGVELAAGLPGLGGWRIRKEYRKSGAGCPAV